MTKSFLKFVLVMMTVLAANFAFAQDGSNTSVNPGTDPNLPIQLTKAQVEANISHCTPGHNYCAGCCAHEIQVEREAHSAAIKAALDKTKSGGTEGNQ